MLIYPLSVFIDTSFYELAKFDFSKSSIFSTLVRYVDSGKIKLYLHDIVVGEVEKHIIQKYSKLYKKYSEAKQACLKELSDSEIREMSIAHLLDINSRDSIRQEALKTFQDFIIASSATILDSSNVDCNQIIADYFQSKYPFEDKELKKAEFPDAIMAASLKTVFSEETPVYVISTDDGFLKSFGEQKGFTGYTTLKCVFDLINQQDSLYDAIKNFVVIPSTHASICSLIKNELESIELPVDGWDYDRKGFAIGNDYIETYIDSISDIDYSFASIDEITDNEVLLSITCSARIEVTCTCIDTEKSVWDSETKGYIFSEMMEFEETHTPEFDSALRVKMIFTEDEQVPTFEISGLTFGISLDQESRIKRNPIRTNITAENVEADTMDTLEEYYKH